MTYVGRTVYFNDEGVERSGIVERVSNLGAMLITLTDNIDDTKQIIVGTEVAVSTEPQHLSWRKASQTMINPEINARRLDTIRGPVATELVAIPRNRLRLRKRVIAIGRSVAGSGFVVTTGGAATVQPPADFAEAVAEVDSKPVQPWPAAAHDEIDNEQVGAEIAAAPYNW